MAQGGPIQSESGNTRRSEASVLGIKEPGSLALKPGDIVIDNRGFAVGRVIAGPVVGNVSFPQGIVGFWPMIDSADAPHASKSIAEFQEQHNAKVDAMLACPDCKGTGQYVGLTHTEPCRACGPRDAAWGGVLDSRNVLLNDI